jgi:hypothetical protein
MPKDNVYCETPEAVRLHEHEKQTQPCFAFACKLQTCVSLHVLTADRDCREQREAYLKCMDAHHAASKKARPAGEKPAGAGAAKSQPASAPASAKAEPAKRA